ncbi:hypothetical protein [Streptomyces sp. NPDC001401]|uniref:hypothetical protein n=1 Tax=Streptomyces sp. NPDC001401 TaxID=3364570 RepID=UPI0036865060
MQRKHERLATPWAAGVAGVVFAVLLAAAIVLMRIALPDGTAGGETTVDAAQRSAVRTALELLPFAGIAFLWFMGALREQAGEGEDRFFSTVFLGSGLVFVATLFGAAAAAGTVLDESQQHPPFGRHFVYVLLTTYALRMAAVFIITTSTIGRRSGALPRPLIAVGYLAGLALLVVGASVPWSELVFPAWALLLSVNILRGRRPARTQPATST